jgi:RNA polymerase sigma-70 factor (ECF subfamily)
VTNSARDTHSAKTQIAALIGARVHLRFHVSADDLAEHVLSIASRAGGNADPIEYVRTLNLDDLYLALACARGDEAAWAECSQLHVAFMRDFARRFLKMDAADLVDEVIADLWKRGKLERYEGRSSLRTWLGAVVAHAALQAGKATVRGGRADRKAAAEHGTTSAAQPESEQSARLLADAAAEALTALAAPDKLLLRLYYEQGLTLDEIAPILDVSKATLSRRLKRVRDHVRGNIERITRNRFGLSSDAMRSGVDLRRLELDLGVLLGEGPSKT